MKLFHCIRTVHNLKWIDKFPSLHPNLYQSMPQSQIDWCHHRLCRDPLYQEGIAQYRVLSADDPQMDLKRTVTS